MTIENSTITEEYGQTVIGVQKYPISLRISSDDLKELKTIRDQIDSNSAIKIRSKMHNNAILGFGEERPLSAYFTLFPKNKLKQKGFILVEWGKILTNGDAKLHTYLNEHINHAERYKEGATIVSGHICPIQLDLSDDFYNFALLDSLTKACPVTPSSREFAVVTSLIKANYIPITSDGYPVELNL